MTESTPESPFTAHRRVAVVKRGRLQAIRTVARVTKRFVELKNGSRYQPDGSEPYPRQRDGIGYYESSAIRPANEADLLEGRRLRLVYRLQHTPWDSLPVAVMAQVMKVLDSTKLAEDQTPQTDRTV